MYRYTALLRHTCFPNISVILLDTSLADGAHIVLSGSAGIDVFNPIRPGMALVSLPVCAQISGSSKMRETKPCR
jgi:hypothetical protein